jgi:ABC-2 type transport system ATP-binding protein
MTFIVKTSNLWKSYGDKKALVGVSLHIPEGEIYGLLGPNGAGKTSIIGIISGILRFDKGNFSIAGKKHVSQIKNLVGLVPQDAQLYYDMTCLNHLIFFAKLQGFNKLAAKQESLRVLKLVDLFSEQNNKVGSLSHGMRRRLGFAQALIGSPKVLILDEPTNGLDPSIAKSIRLLILELKKSNTTIIFSSHNIYEVEEICDSIGILNKGKLIKEGLIKNLKKTNSVFVSVRGLKKEVIKRIKKKHYVKRLNEGLNSLEVEFKHGDFTNDLLKFLIDNSLVIDKFKKGESLEDIFLDIVGKK